MHIYLVRHTLYHNPENIYAFHLPLYLSPEGRKHAGRVGDWFKNNVSSAIPIYTSPIVRTVQTAEIIASINNFQVQTDERLIDDEHIDIYIKRGEIVEVQVLEDGYHIERIKV